MSILSYIHFLAALVYLLLALFMLYRSKMNMIGISGAGLQFCFFIWSIGASIIQNPLTSRETASLFVSISSLGWICFPPFYLRFAETLYKKTTYRQRFWQYSIIGALTLFFLTLQFSGNLTTIYNKEWFGWSAQWNRGLGTNGYLLFMLIMFIIPTWHLWKASKEAHSIIKKQQARTLVFSAIGATAPTIITDILIRFADIYTFPPIGNLFALIWAYGFSIAIIRYHFLRIDTRIAADKILSNMADIVILLDTELRIVEVNNTLLKMTGYSKQELINTSITRLFPDRQPKKTSLFKTSTEIHTAELELKTKEHKIIPVNFNFSQVPGVGIVCVGTDNALQKEYEKSLQQMNSTLEKEVNQRTAELLDKNKELEKQIIERERAEKLLIESQQRLRVLFDNGPDAIYLTDTTGKILESNLRFEELLGFSSEELLGENYLQMKLFSPAQLARAATILADNAAGKATPTEEFTLRRKDGGKIPVTLASHPIKIDKTSLVLTVVRDISQTKKTEAAYSESEERFQQAFEKAYDAIVWVNKESKEIVNCNDATEKIVKKKKTKLLYRHYSVLNNNKHNFDLDKLFDFADTSSLSAPLELELLDSMDNRLTIEATKSLVHIEGEPVIQAVLRDVTRRLADEKEKCELESQLHQSEKMKAIGQLAGGMAHDFNNMLGAIAGYAEMIKGRVGDSNPMLAKYAKGILSAAQRSNELTAQLLTFARKGTVKLVAIDIHDIINEVIHLLEHTINKNITMESSYEATPSSIRGDKAQLQNAILNLAVNARDAMPKGGKLTFRSSVTEIQEPQENKKHAYQIEPGNYVKIEVCDTGIGMNPETCDRIFEPFFTTKEKGKGTGLGLASVYGTIKSHNGYIDVKSKENQGTTFSILLPLLAEPLHHEQEKPEEVAHQGANETILIVDDEEFIRDVASEMLENLGYQTITVSDGVEAVEYAKSSAARMDLVLLDMIMPKMGGYDCYMELKKIKPGLRVVVMSGYAYESEARSIVEAGANIFLPKPFSSSKLGNVVEKALAFTKD